MNESSKASCVRDALDSVWLGNGLQGTPGIMFLGVAKSHAFPCEFGIKKWFGRCF